MRGTALAAVLALAAAACGSDSNGASSTSTTAQGPAANDSKQLYELAKAEGSLVAYTPWTEATSRTALFAAFEAAYPGIKVEHLGKPGQQILEQFLTEKRAGLNNSDVIVLAEQESFRTTFQSENMIDRYVPEGAEVFAPELTVPGLAYPSQTINIGAVYNADKVTPAEVELLKSYKGWGDPTWKGRANVVSPASTPVGLAIYHWTQVDKNLGWEWMEKRAANKEVVFTSAVPAVERVRAGEFAVSFNNYDVTSSRLMGPDSPLRIVYPEYTMTSVFGVGLASKAKHPNAAKLFINWVLSKQGQEAIVAKLGYPSVRPDVTASPIKESWYKPPTKTQAANGAEAAKVLRDVLDRWNGLFSSGR